VTDAPVFIGGHSLGGARAPAYAYSRIKRGLRVDGIYMLAPPKPGNHTIAQTLFSARARFQQVRSLWNGRDYVPALPIDLELLNEEYLPVWQSDEVYEPPAPGTPIDLDPWHNIALYQAGARKIPDNPGVAIPLAAAADEIARLYDDVTGWDWINPVDGAYWAMKIFPSGAKLMIPRGTKTAREWLQDFDAVQIDVMGARMARGFWAGVAAVQDALDAQLA
jgi:hypothetical protein